MLDDEHPEPVAPKGQSVPQFRWWMRMIAAQ